MLNKHITIFFLMIILLDSIVLGGCTRNLHPAQAPVLQHSAQTVITTLRQRSAAFRSMRASAKIKVETGNERHGFSSAILFSDPDRLRIDVFGPFGILGAVVTVIEEDVKIYIPRENALIETNIDSEKLTQILGSEMVFSDLMSLMDGGLKFLQNEILTSEIRVDGSQYLLTAVVENGTYFYWLDPETLNPSEIHFLDVTNSLVFRLFLENYHQVYTSSYPQHITIERPREDQKMDIKYIEQEINTTLKNTDFEFKIPENVQRYE